MTLKVAVIDDHPIVRDALCNIVGQAPDFEVVASGSAAYDVEAIAGGSAPDVMILDLKMPGSTLDAIQSLTDGAGRTRVVVFTASAEPSDCVDAIEAGALGYVVKGSSSEELFEALRSVARGREFLSPSIAAQCMREIGRRARLRGADPAYDLSHRETQIVEHLLHGASNKAIALALSISEKTVKHYMTQIMQKLNAKNRVEVALTIQRDRNQSASLR